MIKGKADITYYFCVGTFPIFFFYLNIWMVLNEYEVNLETKEAK